MTTKAVGWFEIYVDDMARAVAFYEAMLSRKLEKMDAPIAGLEMWAFPDPMDESMGASGALVKMEGYSPGAGGTAAEGRAPALAVRSRQIPRETPVGSEIHLS